MDVLTLSVVIVVVGALLALKSVIVPLAGVFCGSVLKRARRAKLGPLRVHGRRR
jgi:hypothetical protein